MKERPLVYPILVSPPELYPDAAVVPRLPIKPTHIATWQVTTEASSSKSQSPSVTSTYFALASKTNSVWILEEREATVETRIEQSTPTHLPSPLLASPSSPHTLSSIGLPSPSRRSRAASSASSTPTSNTARRRVSAFSPPQPPAICVTTTSSASPALEPSTFSKPDREELLETLREQKGKDSISVTRGRDSHDSGRGLGIGGLGRKGLPGVHGKEDGVIEKPHRPSFSRRGSASSTSQAVGTKRDGTKMNKAELQEQVEERAVDAEMERERKADEQESEDRKKVMGAGNQYRDNHPVHHQAVSNLAPSSFKASTQVILPGPGRGSIVAMRKVLGIDSLIILRSSGDLDFVSLRTGKPTLHVDLSSLDDGSPTAGAFSSRLKQRIRLPEPVDWQGVEVCEIANNVVLVLHARPFPNLFTQSTDGTTRLVMLKVSPDGLSAELRGRADLPGVGVVACSQTHQGLPFLLHSTSTSLMAYPLNMTNPGVSPEVANPSLHKSRSISAFHSLLPSSKPGVRLDGEDDTSRPLIARRSSHSGPGNSPENVSDAPSRFDAFSDSLGGKGLSKLLASRKLGKAEAQPTEPPVEFVVGEGYEVERDGGGGWVGMRMTEDGSGVGWTIDSFDIFEASLTSLSVTGSCHVGSAINDVRMQSGNILVSSPTSTSLFVQSRNLDKNSSTPRRREFQLDQILSSASSSLDVDGLRLLLLDNELDLVEVTAHSVRRQVAVCSLPSELPDSVCGVLQYGNNVTFVTDGDGVVSRRSSFHLAELHYNSGSLPETDRLRSRVSAMTTCAGPEGKVLLVAGDEDGAIRLWQADDMRLLGDWTPFDHAVRAISLLDLPAAGHLKGCILCASEDGTIAIISLTTVDLLHTIPGSRAHLHRVFLGGQNILITYTSGKARVWNSDTGEFRRSTGFDAAEEMLNESEWVEIQLDSLSGEALGDNALSSGQYPLPKGSDAARLLRLDLRQLGRRLQYNASSTTSSLDLLRNLLSAFLTFGLDECCDTACAKGLRIPRSENQAVAGDLNDFGVVLPVMSTQSLWKQSPASTAARQLAIVTLLRPFLEDAESERWAAEAIAFYTTSLPDVIGDGFQEPPLAFFADHYLDSAVDVHQAARMLFGGRLGRMQTAEINELIEVTQRKLPIHQKGSLRQSGDAAEALTVVGGIALERFTSMSPSVLRDTTLSIAFYLHDDKSPHKALAIELCSKGFQTWQAYTDAMDLLRRLFHLATRKDPQASSSVTGSGVAAQARIAVLHIAGSNTPLFMTTLSMDILDAQSVEHRTSIMKLCVFMARKRPEILEHGLPRIAEAVVKSLDPNVASMREEVWHAATVILNELVLAFPAIDFFSGTQKLAVGTHEGAIIMYELKTASRLYVLEPHAHPVSAVAFSSDGRRLITVCLDEGVVTVWKIGSSLSGFFTVGGPPRQGGATGQPFRRYEFTRIDNAPLDSTAALNEIKISWPALRTVKIEIQETAMSFAT